MNKKTEENNKEVEQRLESVGLKEEFSSFVQKSKDALVKSNKRFTRLAQVGAVTSMLPLVGLNTAYVNNVDIDLNTMWGLSALALSGAVVLGVGLYGHSSKQDKLNDLEDYSNIENKFYKEQLKEIKDSDFEKMDKLMELELNSAKGLGGIIRRVTNSFSNAKEKREISLTLVEDTKPELKEKEEKLDLKGVTPSMRKA